MERLFLTLLTGTLIKTRWRLQLTVLVIKSCTTTIMEHVHGMLLKGLSVMQCLLKVCKMCY